MHLYDQDCHYGYRTMSFNPPRHSQYDKDKFVEVVECHNDQCKEQFCKFKHFAGIPDSECEHYRKNSRYKI